MVSSPGELIHTFSYSTSGQRYSVMNNILLCDCCSWNSWYWERKWEKIFDSVPWSHYTYKCDDPVPCKFHCRCCTFQWLLIVCLIISVALGWSSWWACAWADVHLCQQEHSAWRPQCSAPKWTKARWVSEWAWEKYYHFKLHYARLGLCRGVSVSTGL